MEAFVGQDQHIIWDNVAVRARALFLVLPKRSYQRPRQCYDLYILCKRKITTFYTFNQRPQRKSPPVYSNIFSCDHFYTASFQSSWTHNCFKSSMFFILREYLFEWIFKVYPLCWISISGKEEVWLYR